jgi:hypothetical protein
VALDDIPETPSDSEASDRSKLSDLGELWEADPLDERQEFNQADSVHHGNMNSIEANSERSEMVSLEWAEFDNGPLVAALPGVATHFMQPLPMVPRASQPVGDIGL